MFTMSRVTTFPYLPEPAIKKSWRPHDACMREEIWFDAAHQILYVDFRKTCDACLRITGWENGLVTSHWNPVLDIWEHEEWDPCLPLPMASLRQDSQTALIQFFSGIPDDVKQALQPIKWRQFVLLKMIRTCPQTLDLVKSNPALALLLAHEIAQREIHIKEGCSWVLRKRRDIVGFCGGPATESAVRVLGKIHADQFTRETVLDIHAAMEDDDFFPMVCGCGKIPVSCISFFDEYPYFVSWVLSILKHAFNATLGEMDEPHIRNDLLDLWNDTESIGEAIVIEDPVTLMTQCTSVNALRNLHDRWCRIMNKNQIAASIESIKTHYGTTTFPRPPLPGNDRIVPITTVEELLMEGIVMHNCVGTYADRVMQGESSIYRVLEPQRVTLEIAPEEDCFVIRQMKTKCNGMPSQAADNYITTWFLETRKRQSEIGKSKIDKIGNRSNIMQ